MCTAAKNWTKPTETSRISVVRDVADRFWGWQQLTNCRDPKNKSGALGGDILKSKDLLKTTRNSDNLVAPLANEMAFDKERLCGAPWRMER